jgi:integrase
MQAADRLRRGSAYITDLTTPTASVFTDELGVRQTPKSATNAIARLAKKAGISTTALHSLRHTAATFLNDSGVNPATGAKILGHANPTTALNIYSHVGDGDERRAISALSSRLAQAKATARG